MKQLLLCGLLAAVGSAQAGDLYGAVGFPIAVVGYSQPVTDSIALRGEFSTIGSFGHDETNDGIRYEGQVKADRWAVFADWYVSGGMRVSAGLTATNAKAKLAGVGTGSSITIGNTTYAATPDDRFDVDARFPRTMPYLGVGYGMSPTAGKGWGWNLDIGFAFGKPKVSGRVSGPTLPGVVTQADIDAEVADVRDDADKIKGLPQVTVGVSYRF